MGIMHVGIIGIFQVIVPILFLLIISIIIYLNIREIALWSKENKQPVLTQPAKLIKKRVQVIHHMHQFEIHLYYPASTYYFAAFEIDNGEELELELDGVEFSKITEGDSGMLTYQGKYFLQFTPNEKG